ncbi:undecaprenyl-diphosphate phosphatase [Cytophagaceae bacterium ABcell3]|nr:undecaprenyl-diphosphate phosphatase [Cytophagaceae bacterium ABcell3]
MSTFEAFLLGILQGLTEFLPISSSGHIEIGSFILGTDPEDNLIFQLIVHAATTLSTIVVFRKDIGSLFQGFFTTEWNDSKDYVSKLVLSAIPLAFAGFFLEDYIEEIFAGRVLLIGFMFLITALLLGLTYYYKGKGTDISYKKAMIIGIAQSIAILPGISRSGSTIASALLIGVDKYKATRFSFLMILMPLMGASLLKFIQYLQDPTIAGGISGPAMTVGFLAAFFSGWLSCKWMIDIVKKGKLIYFAIYCFIVGIIAIVTYM